MFLDVYPYHSRIRLCATPEPQFMFQLHLNTGIKTKLRTYVRLPARVIYRNTDKQKILLSPYSEHEVMKRRGDARLLV